jgi:predicted transcriptional regulator YdeE
MKYIFAFFLTSISMIIFATDRHDLGDSKMHHSQNQLGEIKLIGIKVRTSYINESKWETGKIFPCVAKYFHEHLFDKIPCRNKPGTTYCVYTEYSSDYTGAYTYFIGEEVSSIDHIPVGLEALIIPSQKYVKFTTNSGAMPSVLKKAWQDIWDMTSEELGGIRKYHSDFEIYDERASDHNNLVLDIYIGIK